jgi:shikimate dehydrogenase
MSPLHFAVLGDPVAHSRSPAIHNAALRELGIEGSYGARRADLDGLHRAIGELRAGTLAGINITMPLKEDAAASADTLSPLAASAGSVNTMGLRDGVVAGESTDAVAMRSLLRRPQFGAETILVLGAGGAASAVIQAMAGRTVAISARQDDRSRELVRRLGMDVDLVPFGTPVPGALLVNATPLGMAGEDLPHGLVELSSGLIDLAYGPRVPPATQEARARGLPVVDGIEFLTLQAAESFTWWTGLEAPFEVMLEAAKNG